MKFYNLGDRVLSSCHTKVCDSLRRYDETCAGEDGFLLENKKMLKVSNNPYLIILLLLLLLLLLFALSSCCIFLYFSHV